MPKGLFPCPVCTEGLEVRRSKKDKPYIVCLKCGVQMFVRNRPGIQAFYRLVEQGEERDPWSRLSALQGRYRLKCPECGLFFWAAPSLVSTSWLDGSLLGFQCPGDDCDGVAEWKEDES